MKCCPGALPGQLSKAEKGQLGLQPVAQQMHSVIMLDLLMAVMDGFEVVHELWQTEHGKV